MSDNHKAWAPAYSLIFAVGLDGKATAIGNAFVVAAIKNEGIVLTAAHNVRALDQLAARGSPFRTLSEARLANPHFESRLHRVLGGRPNVPGEIPTMNCFSTPGEKDFDVAMGLITLSNDADSFPLRFSLKLIPPSVGTQVWAIGWQDFAKIQEEIAETATWSWKTTAMTVGGRISAYSLSGSGLTPGAVFEIEGDFGPGLSGSPVICDVDGLPYVCGVVSSSSNKPNTAVASAIWPALALEMTVTPVDGDPFALSLYKLAQAGAIVIAPGELERFTVIPGKSAEFVNYDPTLRAP